MTFAYRTARTDVLREPSGRPLHGERDLWLAVVLQVLDHDSDEEVLRWLRSDDGPIVCALAGVDPEWVRRLVPRRPGRHIELAQKHEAQLAYKREYARRRARELSAPAAEAPR